MVAGGIAIGCFCLGEDRTKKSSNLPPCLVVVCKEDAPLCFVPFWFYANCCLSKKKKTEQRKREEDA